MSPSRTRSSLSFASLPLEIRQQVYEYVLTVTPCTDVQLLRVCSQIYSEAHRYLFKRPLTFQSQSDFLRWVPAMGRKNLRLVKVIQMRFLDMGPDEVIQILGHQLGRAKVDSRSHSPTAGPYEEACDRQIQNLAHALKCLPNICSFTLLKSRKCDPGPCPYMQTALLQLIVRIYPRLQSLTLSATKISLSPVQLLQDLRTLRFCGWSTSTAAETCEILQNLPLLENLEVSGPPAGLTFEQRPGYTGPLRVQSFTSDVLKGIRPLKSLTILDLDQDPYHTTAILNGAFFDALSTHHPSLETLRLYTHCPPRPKCDRFARYLSNSSLSHLEIVWYTRAAEITKLLPRSLRSLRIAISGPGDVIDIGSNLITHRRELPVLRQLVFECVHAGHPEVERCVAQSFRRKGLGSFRASLDRCSSIARD